VFRRKQLDKMAKKRFGEASLEARILLEIAKGNSIGYGAIARRINISVYTISDIMREVLAPEGYVLITEGLQQHGAPKVVILTNKGVRLVQRLEVGHGRG
jgi:predicted transcriptional regulator